jgi:quinol monooxygenase YgiN
VPIYQTAHYQVQASAVDKVKAAIAEFVGYVAANEPGSTMYTAWQQADDPTRFVHLFEFADEAAHLAHGSSEAVRRFEAVYRPELTGGPVVFTDYVQLATNREAR